MNQEVASAVNGLLSRYIAFTICIETPCWNGDYIEKERRKWCTRKHVRTRKDVRQSSDFPIIPPSSSKSVTNEPLRNNPLPLAENIKNVKPSSIAARTDNFHQENPLSPSPEQEILHPFGLNSVGVDEEEQGEKMEMAHLRKKVRDLEEVVEKLKEMVTRERQVEEEERSLNTGFSERTNIKITGDVDGVHSSR